MDNRFSEELPAKLVKTDLKNLEVRKSKQPPQSNQDAISMVSHLRSTKSQQSQRKRLGPRSQVSQAPSEKES